MCVDIYLYLLIYRNGSSVGPPPADYNVSQCMIFPTMWYVRKQMLRSACAYAQSDISLCLSLEYSMSVKLLIEHHLEFLRLKGGCTGSSESTHVKMPHCWK